MKKKFVIFVLVAVVAVGLVCATGTYNLTAAFAEENVSYTIDKNEIENYVNDF